MVDCLEILAQWYDKF
uniref:Uncharacterized protein MANES_17G074300 n=1 Tax=Rhizophora mucronata TaxID=61149 RepID=A0A2P2QR35_RHIMU